MKLCRGKSSRVEKKEGEMKKAGETEKEEKRDTQTESWLISWPADNSSFSELESCAQGPWVKVFLFRGCMSHKVSSSSHNSMAECQLQMHNNKK